MYTVRSIEVLRGECTINPTKSASFGRNDHYNAGDYLTVDETVD